nr:hypothetical protein CFP56_01879 [Quercus suber]
MADFNRISTGETDWAPSTGVEDPNGCILPAAKLMLSKFLPEKRYESHPIVDHHLTQQTLMKKVEMVEEHLQLLLEEGL